MKRCDNRGKGFAEVIKSVGVANGEFEEHFRAQQDSMRTSIEKADERVEEATRKLNQIEDFVKKLAKASEQTEQAVSGLTDQLKHLQVRMTNEETRSWRLMQDFDKLREEVGDLAGGKQRPGTEERRSQPGRVKNGKPVVLSESLEALPRVGINVMDLYPSIGRPKQGKQ